MNRILLLLAALLLSACHHNVRPECSAATEPVVITQTEVRYVRIDEKLTEPVEDKSPEIVTCGDALKAAEIRGAGMATCNARLNEIGTVEGTEKDDG